MPEQDNPNPARQANSNGRTPLLVLTSVVVGFLLPVCSCAFLILVSFAGVGLASGGPAPPSVGLGDAVAIVRIEGVISSGDKPQVSPGAVSGMVIEDLRAAASDPSVKAIVLRVDSPGGTVTGATQIYEVLTEIEKPIVASMASVAASGGYQVCAPADHIIARPDTVTGSIGVVMTLFNAEELIDKIGVDVIALTSGPNKTIGSMWENITPQQQEILKSLIDESYNTFVDIVADGRGMSRDKVLELADGRIYSGRQAVENGLVDELGNLQDAINKAAELGGISGKPRIVEYEHLPGLDQLLTGISGRLSTSEADQVMQLLYRFTTPSIEYRYVGPGSE
ncbi:MAG: signal peptide peptidase SppA [Anaerolineae bacterium]